MAPKGTDSYLLGQWSPAAYIEEEVVTVVETGNHTYLFVTDATFATHIVFPGLSRDK